MLESSVLIVAGLGPGGREKLIVFPGSLIVIVPLPTLMLCVKVALEAMIVVTVMLVALITANCAVAPASRLCALAAVKA
jgi:hypothetical protein